MNDLTAVKSSIPVGHNTHIGATMWRRGNNDRLIILIPGLLEDGDTKLFRSAAQFFAKHGFSVLAINIYGHGKDHRKFPKTTLSGNGRIVSTIANSFKRDFGDISLIAHSLGSVVALASQCSAIRRVALWDPSLDPKDIFNTALAVRKEHDGYIFDMGISVRVDNRVIRNITRQLPLTELIRRSKHPTAVIAAGHGGAKIGRNIYYKNLHVNKAFRIIEGADHDFIKTSHQKQLFAQTLFWLNKSPRFKRAI